MRQIFFLLSCLLTAPLNAEMIGEVEYHLPESAKEWEIKKMPAGQDVGTTILYTPKGPATPGNVEFFGVNSNSFPTDLKDRNLLESELKKQFPTQQIEVKQLGQDDHSVLYEWDIKDNGVEKLHVWTRVFSLKGGTVLLVFQTEKTQDLANAEKIWTAVLKDAKVVEQPK